MFLFIVDPALVFLRKRVREFAPSQDMSLVSSLMKVFEAGSVQVSIVACLHCPNIAAHFPDLFVCRQVGGWFLCRRGLVVCACARLCVGQP